MSGSGGDWAPFEVHRPDNAADSRGLPGIGLAKQHGMMTNSPLRSFALVGMLILDACGSSTRAGGNGIGGTGGSATGGTGAGCTV